MTVNIGTATGQAADAIHDLNAAGELLSKHRDYWHTRFHDLRARLQQHRIDHGTPLPDGAPARLLYERTVLTVDTRRAHSVLQFLLASETIADTADHLPAMELAASIEETNNQEDD